MHLFTSLRAIQRYVVILLNDLQHFSVELLLFPMCSSLIWKYLVLNTTSLNLLVVYLQTLIYLLEFLASLRIYIFYLLIFFHSFIFFTLYTHLYFTIKSLYFLYFLTNSLLFRFFYSFLLVIYNFLNVFFFACLSFPLILIYVFLVNYIEQCCTNIVFFP